MVAYHRALQVPAKYNPGADYLDRLRRPRLVEDRRSPRQNLVEAVHWPLSRVQMAAVPLTAHTHRRRLAGQPDVLS